MPITSPYLATSNAESKEPPNKALRELAGRVNALTYRDMQRLAELMFDSWAQCRPSILGQRTIIEMLLDAANKLEKA